MKEREPSLNALDEARLLKSLRDHPCIIRFQDAFLVHGINRICIVMEQAQGDLKQELERQARNNKAPIPITVSSSWIAQIALGLDFLHHQGIVHRDVKPANLLILNDGRIVLGDFGASRCHVTEFDGTRTLLGTPYYLSPEILQGNSYGTQSDVWSFGCVVFEIATGGRYKPFQARTVHELERAVRLQDIQWNRLPSPESNLFLEIIQGALCLDPTTRWRMHDILHDPIVVRALGSFVYDVTEGRTVQLIRTQAQCLFDQLQSEDLRHTLLAGIHLGLAARKENGVARGINPKCA